MKRLVTIAISAGLLCLSSYTARAQDDAVPPALQAALGASTTPATSTPAAPTATLPAAASEGVAAVPVPSHPASEAAIPAATVTSQPNSTAFSRAVAKKSAQDVAATAQAVPKAPPAAAPPAAPPDYDPSGEPYTTRYYKKAPVGVVLSLLRRPGFQAGQFALHIAGQYMVNGCPRLSEMPHSVDFANDGTVKIDVQNYTVDMRNLTDKPEYDCKQTPHTPSADIVLDRDQLLEKGTHKIEITNSDRTDYYDITLTPHQIRLQPSADMVTVPHFKPAQAGATRNPLQHWFYPAGTVILYVPGAGSDQDLSAEIDAAARQHDLVPLSEMWPEFKSPLALAQYRYYVDSHDKLMKGVPLGEGVSVGSVAFNKTIYGLQGDEIERKSLPVYARAPNSYE